MRNFNQAIHELEAIKGARELILHAFEEIIKKSLRGKGALYELQAALRLQEEGHIILEFSRKAQVTVNLKERTIEFDIITNKNVIECKDFYFPKLPFDREEFKALPKIDRFFTQCDAGVIYAKSQGLPYHVVFKSSIPPELEWLKGELASKGVASVTDNFY